MDETGKCILPHHHSKNEESVIGRIPDIATIQAVSDAMKQLGDPSRLRIFWILCHTEECVINLAAAMQMSSPAVSHHLRLLKGAGLIVSRRMGKEMYYRAADSDLAQKFHHMVEEVAKISCPDRAEPQKP